MIRRPLRSTHLFSSAASFVYIIQHRIALGRLDADDPRPEALQLAAREGTG
jgi:hypothetical protein